MSVNHRSILPYVVQCDGLTAMRLVRDFPGVDYSGDGRGVRCGREALEVVLPAAGKVVPSFPEVPLSDLPGYRDYQNLLARQNFTPREYQVTDAVYLANREYAILANPMRSGKSLTTLLAAVLAGHKRILVVCPSISKWVWGDEIHKWTGEDAVIVEGLSRSRALQYCGACKQSGRLPNGDRCDQCRQRNGSTYGYRIIDVQETQVPPKKMDSQAWHCRKHLDFTSPAGEAVRCAHCRSELEAKLRETKVLIVNYDILSGRGFKDKRGRIIQKKSQGGWADVIAALPFDLAIVDESHMLRGFEPSLKKAKSLVQTRVQNMTSHIPVVWCVTGTPIFGMVRDLYGQLNVMTNGLVGTPAAWAARYCDAKQNDYGWDTSGRSNESELQARLSTCMVARHRSEILKDMPAKQRRVLYLENDKPSRVKITSDSKGTIARMIDAVAVQKHDTVIANVLPELSEGLKVYVLTFRPKHAERLAKELAKKMNGRDWRTRMNSVQAEVFVGQTSGGIDPKRRRDLAKAFCAHKGAAVFVATILSMPGSISLKGVTSVHMVDFDTSPSSMEQAEDRGYEPGTTGYSITHYVVRNSIDDHLAAVVIPKFETKDRMLNDENAQNVLGAFANEEETLEEVLKRHTAHVTADDEDDWT